MLPAVDPASAAGQRALRGLAIAAALAAVASPARGAAPEEILALRHAPVVRLVAQAEACGPGEPFQPTDVEALFGSDDVALRGPWDRANVVAIGPTSAQLGRGLFGYHLDFPGNPLAPACDYERWSRRALAAREPTTFARVVGERERPGRLALQYWLFYPYNDFNNKHEGDWEMIQLVFEAADAAQALEREPTHVGYSQHEGAERAAWDDPKLERVGGTRPVVYAASGSHANYFEPGLFLGRSSAQGVGCDDTGGPWTDVEPRVVLLPASDEAARAAHPWLGFEGRWGEQQPSFYNGPTGPNAKPQWSRPIAWSEESWRAHSYAVVGGASLGPRATDFFCGAVEGGSDLLRGASRRPGLVLGGVSALVALLVWTALRTEWRPSAPLRLARRRAWGQILTSSWRMYAGHPRLFVGIGLLFVPVSLAISGAQLAVLRFTGLAARLASEGEANTLMAAAALAVGLAVGLIAFAAAQAACAHAMSRLDAGRRVTALEAWRRALPRTPSLAGALAALAAAIALLLATGVGAPVAAWLAGRGSLLAQAVQLERRPARDALRRSFAVVRGRWWRVALLLSGVTGAALLPGPLLGSALLLATGAPFALVNLASSLVYAITLPFVAIATTYLFHDLRVRARLAPSARAAEDVLPAEI
jgi:hypothetical protein